MQLEIKNSPKSGRGLFTNSFIDKDHIILRFDGAPLLKRDIKDFSGKVATCYLQIGPSLYLDLEGHPSYFSNHSCSPNCGIRIATNKAFLISLRPIEAGQELTYDYSTTSTEDLDTWSMPCNCSLFNCRKLITGWHSVPKKVQERYLAQDIVPYYLINT
jgi:hypothetical protein